MDEIETLTTAERRVLEALQKHGGYIRTGNILEAGIDHHVLARLTERGLLERVRRGLYRRADTISGDIALADVAAAAPEGVICLLSALSHYELTTTTPWEVYLAIPRKGWPPKIDYPPVRVVFYSGTMFGYGIREEPLSTGQTVRMYSPEKSIADAFHFEGHAGRDVALEALKTYMGRRRERNIPALLKAADICRVRSTVQQYVEALA
jgi:predicted transcriptional regulator of viral defense system